MWRDEKQVSEETTRQKSKIHTGPPPLRRRVFLIKHRFQFLFAVYPILFLLLFLVCGGIYLYFDISEILNYYKYSPHSTVDNLWFEISPSILKLAGVGGGVFLFVLALWVWLRFKRLKDDIILLSSWAIGFDGKDTESVITSLKEKEVKLLGEKLVCAALVFDGFDGEIATARGEFFTEVNRLKDLPDEELPMGIITLEDKYRILRDKINTIRIDEGLS
jgi:hypothetical protein